MSTTAIDASGICKVYRIGDISDNETFRELASRTLASPINRFREKQNEVRSESWINALTDVSFQIERGEKVGIIGGNGAGKSTLLKILSRVTRPTQGNANVYGRVGSLLEIGTGFHHELTGRENIFLNGAIMGMKRDEVLEKFDEIVDFASMGEFIDTPVKRYSSGMFMRLAFSVVINLKPDILLVDEVLAVGDHGFQTQAIQKMRSLNDGDNTILFVSHNLSTVSRLCDRALLMENGRLVDDGTARSVVDTYVSRAMSLVGEYEWDNYSTMLQGESCRLVSIRVGDDSNSTKTTIFTHDKIRVEMIYDVLVGGELLSPYFQLFNAEEVEVFWSHDMDRNWNATNRPAGRYSSVAWIPKNILAEGIYHIEFGCETSLGRYPEFHTTHHRLSFQLVDHRDADNARGEYFGELGGVIRPKLEWVTNYSKL